MNDLVTCKTLVMTLFTFTICGQYIINNKDIFFNYYNIYMCGHIYIHDTCTFVYIYAYCVCTVCGTYFFILLFTFYQINKLMWNNLYYIYEGIYHSRMFGKFSINNTEVMVDLFTFKYIFYVVKFTLGVIYFYHRSKI